MGCVKTSIARGRSKCFLNKEITTLKATTACGIPLATLRLLTQLGEDYDHPTLAAANMVLERGAAALIGSLIAKIDPMPQSVSNASLAISVDTLKLRVPFMVGRLTAPKSHDCIRSI